MKRITMDEKAFTGLEAAIVLTAFVVVAAVFSYVVLGAGFFTTQKAKEVVHTGVDQATSSAELAGDVIGYGSGTSLTNVTFYLQLTAGLKELDLNKTVISYTDEYMHNGSLSFIGKGTGTLAYSLGSWNYTQISATTDDNLLEFGEQAKIYVTLPNNVAVNKKFSIEVKPSTGATLIIERTAPSAIRTVMNLN